MLRDFVWNRIDSVAVLRDQIEEWVLTRKHSLYAAAACRIGTGLAVLGLLIANFTTRDLWVGQASIWAEPARAISRFPELAILKDVSSDVLTVVYVVTMLAALAFVLGWRTKAANVITFVGFIAIVGQNPVVGGQGDNLIRLTLLWLLLMRTAEHWSLDSRRLSRASKRSRGEEALPRWLSTSLHNLALVALAVQTILVYTAAGLDKISQQTWQHGTALYYTMQLPEFRPFPSLSDLLSSSTVVLAIVTYTVLLVQLFFAPLLLNPSSRRAVIGLAIAVNVVFAILFAAPWSSLAVIAVTCLFASDEAFESIDEWIRDRFRPITRWIGRRGASVADVVDSGLHRLVYPVTDWVRFTIFRR
ncbi:HTTM domain-containing protein [Aeromicrobium panaciterrae]|uniref:HTTM domain-containing protein n=1 Tax=Aeromicrobium panaciterrae TaxID=363861 RepID=UPI0031DDB829